MSTCDRWIDALVEHPETIHNEDFIKHARSCSSCSALAGGLSIIEADPCLLESGELTYEESGGILDSLRAEEARCKSPDPEISMGSRSLLRHPASLAAAAVAVFALLAVTLFFQPSPAGVPEETVLLTKTRHMRMVIQVEGKPTLSAFLEYTPETAAKRRETNETK